MESWYPVYWNREKAGEVTVTKQGLYYRFVCRVRIPADSRCHLFAQAEGNSRDLGLCIPDGNDFVLQTRVPAKYFEEGNYSFWLQQPKAEVFIRVCSDRPFPAMDRLEKGKFAKHGAETGIVFPASDRPSHSL